MKYVDKTEYGEPNWKLGTQRDEKTTTNTEYEAAIVVVLRRTLGIISDAYCGLQTNEIV